MARFERSVPEDLLRQLAEEIRIWRQETARGPAALDDASLAAYAAGALDDAARTRVEEQLAASPELAEIAAVVRGALAEGERESQGPELAKRLRLPLVLGPDAPALPPPSRVQTFWRVPRWAGVAAMAAAFFLGIGVGALTLHIAVRDLFQVSTERLGGDTSATLDSGITDSAHGQVRKSLSDLREDGSPKDAKEHKSLKDLKEQEKQP